MIRVRSLLIGLAILVLPAIASAQVSFYGTLACSEPVAQGTATRKAAPAIAVSGDKAAAGKKNPGGKNNPRNQKSEAADKSADAPKTASRAAGAVMENCSWSLPLQIGSDTGQSGENMISSSLTGSQSKDTGTHTSHMSNADEFTMNLVGSSVMGGDGVARSRQGTWTFTNGTGALKGITGSGTYSGVARAAGGMSYDIEGAYQLPGGPAGPSPAMDTSAPKPASQS